MSRPDDLEARDAWFHAMMLSVKAAADTDVHPGTDNYDPWWRGEVMNFDWSGTARMRGWHWAWSMLKPDSAWRCLHEDMKRKLARA